MHATNTVSSGLDARGRCHRTAASSTANVLSREALSDRVGR
jgi:hypothetical protein